MVILELISLVQLASFVGRLPSTKPLAQDLSICGRVLDVQKWLRRHCSDYYPLYWEKFQQHDITGRSLIRFNENTLVRLGVDNAEHRQEIWREIMKLRLKTDIIEIRDLERRNNCD